MINKKHKSAKRQASPGYPVCASADAVSLHKTQDQPCGVERWGSRRVETGLLDLRGAACSTDGPRCLDLPRQRTLTKGYAGLRDWSGVTTRVVQEIEEPGGESGRRAKKPGG